MKRKNIYPLFLILQCLFISSAFGQKIAEKKIEYSFKNELLELVFLDLEIHYRLNFEFEESEVENIRITKSIRKTPISLALKQLLEGTNLQFQLEDPNKIIISPSLTISNPSVTAASSFQPTKNNFTVSGLVQDANNGETLPFSNLIIKGSTTGTSTNVDGWFSILNVPSDTVLIEVSYIGYVTQLFRLTPEMDPENVIIKLSPAGQFLQEIVVEAEKQERMMKASTGVSKVSLAPAQLKSIPSLGEKDIFRSLQLLPGVSGSNESSSGLYVRGGTPDQNLVLFDGFTVYHVDHLFGFFSAFNSNAIKDVQLHKGGFESKYGGRLSSVVDITGKDGDSESFNVGGGISLLSFNGYLEMPFANNKGSILLAGRRSFQSDFYNKLFEFADGDSDTGGGDTDDEPVQGPGRRGFGSSQPESWFYDLNGKITFRPGKNVFSLSFYNGKDNLDNSRYTDSNRFGGGFFGGSGSTDFNFQLDIIDKSDWGNTGSSFKWSRQWNSKLYSNALLSYSNYFSFRDRGADISITRDTTTTEVNNRTIEDNDLKDFSFKWDWEYQLHDQHKLSYGVFANQFDIRYDYTQNDTSTILNRDNQGILSGAYLQMRSTLKDKLIIQPGLRVSHFDQTDQFYFEPRLQVQYLATDQIKLKAATGRFYQFANRILREDISQGSRDFWILSDGEQVPVGQSDHLIGGLSYETSDYLFDVEAYYKKLDNITEYSTRFALNGFGRNSNIEFEENFFNGNGTAKGIEFLAQKKSGQLTGWLSYTLGRVEHQFGIYGENPFPASHDVTNEFKLVGSYRINNWTFGGTFVFANGKPYTAPVGAYSLELLDGETSDYFAISDKNVLRYADYHRFDVSINYDFDYFMGGKASAGLSLFNLYNRKNIWYKEFDVIEGSIIETDINLLGFTPSLYFTWSLK